MMGLARDTTVGLVRLSSRGIMLFTRRSSIGYFNDSTIVELLASSYPKVDGDSSRDLLVSLAASNSCQKGVNVETSNHLLAVLYSGLDIS
jgi:hypothetical protein